jgi:hypothetical protein
MMKRIAPPFPPFSSAARIFRSEFQTFTRQFAILRSDQQTFMSEIQTRKLALGI